MNTVPTPYDNDVIRELKKDIADAIFLLKEAIEGDPSFYVNGPLWHKLVKRLINKVYKG